MNFKLFKTAVVAACMVVPFASNATEGIKKKKDGPAKPMIEIVNFKTSYNADNTIDLSCVVKSNCCYNLIVERSKNGKKFSNIGSFSDNKNIANYLMVDESPNKTNYYRLKLIDNLGNISYSNVMVAQLYNTDVLSMLNITPITKEKNLEVGFSLKNRAFIALRVVDEKGNEVYQKRETAETGENNFEITGSKDFTPGNYTMEIRVNNAKQLTVPLIKE